MSFSLPSYRLLTYRRGPIAPTASRSVTPAVAASPAPVAASLDSLLKAIRDEATRLRNTWNAQPAFSLPSLSSLLDRLTHLLPAPTPAPKAAPKPAPKPQPKPPVALPAVGAKEAATRLIAEQPYSQDKSSAIQKLYREESKRQSKRAKIAPGVARGPHQGKDTQRIREIAAGSKAEQAISAKAFKKTSDGYAGPTLNNPNAASGRFDAQAFQPHWVFDTKEDTFPTRPDHDGNGTVKNDLKAYKHGVVGGDQPLEGAFTVTQKGEYTVMTYSLNYVDNKFTNYHEGDSSTVSIYMKKNAKGKLEPAYLYASFHYAGRMVAWKDVQKDADGRPIIRVERGSHALHVYGNGEKVPKDGLHIAGNGQASMNGKALPNRMTWLSAQQNVDNTRYLDPSKSANRPIWNRFFDGYPERREPFHPTLFKR